jgi:tetratricopeptide (TPR) repeat protein
VERRHIEWMLGMTDDAAHGLSGPDHQRWMDRMDVEAANLRVAVRRAIALGDADVVARLARDAFAYATLRDREGEVAEWLADLRQRGIADDAVRARVMVVEALALTTTNHPKEARALLDEAWPLLPDDAEHALDHAMAAMAHGILVSMAGPIEAAVPALAEAARRFEIANSPLGRAYMEVNLGSVAFQLGRLNESDRHYTAAQEIAEALDERALWGFALTMRGLNRLAAGDVAEARGVLAESARRSRDNQQWTSVAHALEGLAAAALAGDQAEVAARALGCADAARRKVGHPPWAVHGSIVDDLGRRARDRLGEPAFQQAWTEGQRWSLTEAVDRTLEALGTA